MSASQRNVDDQQLASFPLHSAVVVVVFMCRPAGTDFSFTHAGHSYDVIEQGRTWQAAAADAVSQQRAGLPGHLAVIESAAENTTIFNQLIANIPAAEFVNTRAPDGGNGFFVWLAANDIAVEGNWIWDGDNNGVGQLFYQGRGNAGGGAVGGLYHNWGTFNGNPQEPDNGDGDCKTLAESPWPTIPAASPANGTTSRR